MISHLLESIITGTRAISAPRRSGSETGPWRPRIEHALVHVDIDNLCARHHLLPSHRTAFSKVLSHGSGGRTSADPVTLGALSDIDEERLMIDVQRFETGELQPLPGIGDGTGRAAAHSRPHRGDMFRRRPAAAAHEIDKTAGGKLANGPVAMSSGVWS